MQVTVTTTRRVEAATVAALLAGVPACQDVHCGHGVPGVSVVLGVEAATGADAYGAALVLLVSEVLPRLEGAILTDVHLSTTEQPVVGSERPASVITAADRDRAAAV